jgi:hypothetical protein
MSINKNVTIQDGVRVAIQENSLSVNGNEFPLPKGNGNNSAVVNGNIFVNGYEFRDGEWKRTLRALFHRFF